jgi:hypothetical protein
MKERVSSGCFLLINLPVLLLFITASGLLLAFILSGAFWLLIPAWASLCGGLLLFRDYVVRKKGLFFSMSSVMEKKGVEALPLCSLKATFCGYCMLRALTIHQKKSGGIKYAGTV